MTPEQAVSLSSAMGAEIAQAISQVASTWYAKEDSKIINGFFPTSLAMAIGFILSNISVEMGLSTAERKELFDYFTETWRATAKGSRLQLIIEKTKTS